MLGISDYVQLIVSDGQDCYHRRDRAEDAHRWLASLVVDPVNLEELLEGWKSYEWYETVPQTPKFQRLEALPDVDAWGGQQVWIDLIRRAVWVDSPFIPCQTSGALTVRKVESESEQQRGINYCLPNHWLVTSCYQSWSEVARAQSTDDRQLPSTSVRSVLYENVVEFLVEELRESELPMRCVNDRWHPPAHWCWKQLPERGKRAGGPKIEDLLAEIHARWLMTKRADLHDKAPRDVLAEHLSFVDQDLWNRESEWQVLSRAPVPLSPDTSRFNGPYFGTHEFVLYYGLVRELLFCGAAWFLGTGSSSTSLLIETLHRRREVWLSTTITDGGPHETHRYLINLERSRTPWVMTKPYPFDCECPVCRMMENFEGMTFGHFDPSGLDYEWPFCPLDSHDEWNFEYESFKESDWYLDSIDKPSAAAQNTDDLEDVTEADVVEPIALVPTMGELASWPIAHLLLHTACELRTLTRQASLSPTLEPLARVLKDGFAQLHDCAIDPGWVDVSPIVSRMFAALANWETTAGETRELFTVATALDVLSSKITQRESAFDASSLENEVPRVEVRLLAEETNDPFEDSRAEADLPSSADHRDEVISDEATEEDQNSEVLAATRRSTKSTRASTGSKPKPRRPPR